MAKHTTISCCTGIVRLQAEPNPTPRWPLIIVGLILLSLAPAVTSSTTVIVWSGIVNLPDGAVIDDDQVVQVLPGTEIRIGEGESIEIEGRLSVQGTASEKVMVNSINGKHNGIQFEPLSRGLGSSISYLTVENASRGIIVIDSDPIMNNITVINADFVAVDLFSSANPQINNLTVLGGGQDVHGMSGTWRYGIGLSLGSGSAPIVNGLLVDNLVTRALNVWGGSGGVIRDLSITNISGATLAVSSGIWVEDSVLLISDTEIEKSDNGVFVRHISEGFTTRPTLENISISNSKYRGIMIEQYNRSKWNDLNVNAVIRNATVSGTGGPDSETQGLASSAVELNTSGAIIEGLDLISNHATGLKAYMIDGTSVFRDIESSDDGSRNPGSGPGEKAGIYLRSASWPVTLEDVSVTGAQGSGILLWKGGATGYNWTTTQNGGVGIDVREFHPEVVGLTSSMNQLSGVRIMDSSNVWIENALTSGNGAMGGINSDKAGFSFIRSNDFISSGKNVSCVNCTSNSDKVGFSIVDSIDLQLTGISSVSPLSGLAISGDGTDLQRNGPILINGANLHTDSINPAVVMQSIDAHLVDVSISGISGGLEWTPSGPSESSIVNSHITGVSGCASFSGFNSVVIRNVVFNCTTQSPPLFHSSNASLSNVELIGPPSLNLSSGSIINWISSSPISEPSSDDFDDLLNVSWMIQAETVNQNGYGIPYAGLNLSFDSHQQGQDLIMPYSGRSNIGPYVGQTWNNSAGWSSVASVQGVCSYGGYSNSTDIMLLNQDISLICEIDLPNQPPFIVWDSPKDGSIFGSSDRVILNATNSWDMDNDSLTYLWTSSIDGILAGPSAISSFIIANSGHEDSPNLSDGQHIITLEVCDTTGLCSIDQRSIELLNLPPSVSVEASPQISPFGVMSLGMTRNATVDLSGTYDPEDDVLQCWIQTSYGANISFSPPCDNVFSVGFDQSEDAFTATVSVYDGSNQPVSWTFTVDHFNELPEIYHSITRLGTTSEDMLEISFEGTSDPEGDTLHLSIESDLDGLIWSGIEEFDGNSWQGRLSKGIHLVTLSAWDNNPENAGRKSYHQVEIEVTNSDPRSVIAFPPEGYTTDSSNLIEFSATGSGDQDLHCMDLPQEGWGLLCSLRGSSNDLVSVVWNIDGQSEPLSTEWSFQSRLPEGQHILTLTVDDGLGNPAHSHVNVSVTPSAPVIIIDSPEDGAISKSNEKVVFDLRNSFDTDGNLFSMTIYSDISEAPILQGVNPNQIYERHISTGQHNLTIILEDSTGLIRTSEISLQILPSSPVVTIAHPQDGRFFPPGDRVMLDATGTVDYDGDLLLLEWALADGTILGSNSIIEANLPPGQHIIVLTAKDSRGTFDQESISIMVGSSAPSLSSLSVSPDILYSKQAQTIKIQVSLVDLDGTSEQVSAVITVSGNPTLVELNDDGAFGDSVPNDGVWTRNVQVSPDESDWMRIDVWARDGDTVSPTLTVTIPIEDDGSDSGIIQIIFTWGAAALGLLAVIGLFVARSRRASTIADIEMIESWSGFNSNPDDEAFE